MKWLVETKGYDSFGCRIKPGTRVGRYHQAVRSENYGETDVEGLTLDDAFRCRQSSGKKKRFNFSPQQRPPQGQNPVPLNEIMHTYGGLRREFVLPAGYDAHWLHAHRTIVEKTGLLLRGYAGQREIQASQPNLLHEMLTRSNFNEDLNARMAGA